jgi:DGQHR domain-containing protein
MITLYGIRLDQKKNNIYLTTATVEQLTDWMDADRIRPDIWKREWPEGYQRLPDKGRFKQIADYIEGKLKVEETLFPNSIILNLRQERAVEFEPYSTQKHPKEKKKAQLGEIIIQDEVLPFFEVDGQHRIRGLIAAYKEL